MLELPWVRDSRDWQYIEFGEVYKCLRGIKLKITPKLAGCHSRPSWVMRNQNFSTLIKKSLIPD